MKRWQRADRQEDRRIHERTDTVVRNCIGTSGTFARSGYESECPYPETECYVSVLYNEFVILVARERSSFRREITLTRMDPEERTSADENDDMTINDGFSDSGHLTKKTSLSS